MNSEVSAKGHRERLRERFARNRFDGFHDYEVLEFLLTYIFRQGDVKPLAKDLIRSFGSFPQVLDAPVAELEKVKGMGPASALALSAFREVLSFYYRAKAKTGKLQVTKMSSLVELLRAQIGHAPQEVLYAILLNASNEIVGMERLGEGTVSQTAAFPRRIVEEALRFRATAVILAHNHPGGIAEPSEDDLNVTRTIQKALALVDIQLQDHLILADDVYYSFQRNNHL